MKIKQEVFNSFSRSSALSLRLSVYRVLCILRLAILEERTFEEEGEKNSDNRVHRSALEHKQPTMDTFDRMDTYEQDEIHHRYGKHEIQHDRSKFMANISNKVRIDRENRRVF